MSLVELKYFNALIDNKPFFDQLIKNKQEAYKRLFKMSRNDDYKRPLHLAKFSIANIVQVLVQVLAQVLTQYLVQVFHFSGIFI